ncbi:MAG TPA: hypothetical protein VFB58_02985 [Chloroflexota bacterium]|nr:hypothetical protein [Chloroflexota bacterium]
MQDHTGKLLEFPPSSDLLRYLVDHRLVVSCPLVKASDFTDYCEQRGLDASRHRLERLEQIGILFPLARGRHFVWTEKLSRSPDGRGYVKEGDLKPGERWDGPVSRREWHLTFGAHHREHLRAYLDEGRLWAPSATEFQPWETFAGGDEREGVESFYSIFQAYTLHFLERVRIDRRIVRVEDLATRTAEENVRAGASLGEWAKEAVDACRGVAARTERVAWLCQVLSNRYFPQTQSDRRTIRVSGWSDFPFERQEDWNRYVRRWYEDGLMSQTLADLNLAVEDIGTMLENIRFEASHSDPLDDWYSFVSFISLAERERLRGAAQLGQHLWTMEGLLRLFRSDLTGEHVPRPHEEGPWLKDLYGSSVPDDTFAFLKGLASHFHVNSNPRLALVVEGDGEAECLPWLIEEINNVSVSGLQIEVLNFRGIDNIAGPRREAGVGLKLLIDYLHRQNTIVYCVLDREGAAEQAVKMLLRASSVLDEGRKVTKQDYVRLWDPNIEFDNFEDVEIARALSDVAEGRVGFDVTEVRKCRFATESGAALKALFLAKTSYELPKRTLLRTLVGHVIAHREQEIDREPRREIVQLAIDIAKYSAGNYPPVGPDIRRKNLESGLFG